MDEEHVFISAQVDSNSAAGKQKGPRHHRGAPAAGCGTHHERPLGGGKEDVYLNNYDQTQDCLSSYLENF